jgi:TonB family protein
VSYAARRCLAFIGLLALLAVPVVLSPRAGFAQAVESGIARKVKNRVPPLYPDLARRMSIGGKVRLAVVVAPNGSVKSTKAMGGHPLLVSAAQDAVRKWKFEPAGDESSGVVEIEFKPEN